MPKTSCYNFCILLFVVFNIGMCHTLPLNLQLPASFEKNLIALSTRDDIFTTETPNIEEKTSWKNFNNCLIQVWNVLNDFEDALMFAIG